MSAEGRRLRQEAEPQLPVADGGQRNLVARERQDHRREDYLDGGHVAAGQTVEKVLQVRA